ncbi:hypothetical protein [Paenibacillus fonticola]|uniref:hypothetical protein n=1 Tax=Paenibacillus fonticola TaxID=379896 RepID=UPI0003623231|nr:hypothetical protein [Paenibacillus fonticola]
MFYLFFLAGDYDFDHFKRIVTEILRNGEIITDSDVELEVITDGFNVSITEGGDSVKFRSEDYGLNFKYKMWFDIYSDHSNGINELMKFVGSIMTRLNGECLLESNGDTPVMIRRDNMVIVDDKGLGGAKRFPFHELRLKYQEGIIN